MLGVGQVPIWVEPGVMRPPDAQTPMILVGPGTGVAPFRSFLEERLAARSQGSPPLSREFWSKYFAPQPSDMVTHPTSDRQSSGNAGLADH